MHHEARVYDRVADGKMRFLGRDAGLKRQSDILAEAQNLVDERQPRIPRLRYREWNRREIVRSMDLEYNQVVLRLTRGR